MEKIQIEVSENDSEEVGSTPLYLCVQTARGKNCDVIIGYPGLDSKDCTLSTGGAILYETPTGTFHIRVKTQNYEKVNFVVTLLSPTPSIAGAFNSTDPSNTEFSELERAKIRSSFEKVKVELRSRHDIAQEQIELINKKLDDILEASDRLGRKDWINYAAGLLTSTCVSAAFTPAVTETIFLTINSAFGWLFSGAILRLM